MKKEGIHLYRLFHFRRLKTKMWALFFVVFLIFAAFPAKAGVFGYLSEFWDNITEATEGTIEFFQSIGNAVAGAIGHIFLLPLKIIFDFFWTLKILFDIFYNLLEISFSIIVNFFIFIGNILKEIFNYTPSGENIIVFDNSIIGILKSIPLFSILLSVISYALIALMVFSILKTLRHF